MKLRQLIFLAVLLLTAAAHASPGPAATDPSDAVVRIIGEGVSITQDSLGTGFFISPAGAVLTCYHVVLGARSIAVVANGVQYRNVLVTAIAPDYDLAELQVLNLQHPATYLPVTQEDPALLLNKLLQIWGDPSYRGSMDPQARFFAPTTSKAYVRSGIYRDPDNKNKLLFSRDIDVISVNPTIYRGVSGAPLIDGVHAIGVLSGSINEGGTEAWVIPVKYVSNLHSVGTAGKTAAQMAPWPKLTLMSDNWKNVRSQAGLGPALVGALDRYGDALYALASAYEQSKRTRFPVFRAEIVRLRTIINQEISRRGPKYLIDSDARVTAVLKGLDKKMDDFENDHQVDAVGQAFEDASDDLTTEIERYFKRLPQTAKNLQLTKNIREARSANTDEILALIDTEEKKLDGWTEQTFQKAGGEPKTLGDARHFTAVFLQAIDEWNALFDPGVKRMFTLCRKQQDIIERIWDADQITG